MRRIFNGECTRRWMEGKNHNYCGHPMPCPKHTDIIFWKYDVTQQIKQAVRQHDRERLIEKLIKRVMVGHPDIAGIKVIHWHVIQQIINEVMSDRHL